VLAADSSSRLFLPIGVAYLLGAVIHAGSTR
jgi:hypothetical protein